MNFNDFQKINAPFANLGDLHEILQLGISDWHATFCKS